MKSLSPEDLRERISVYLSHQRTCIISTTASQGVWAIPVWYLLVGVSSKNPRLEIDCLVPRWSDVAHHLTQDPRVVLIVQATSSSGLSWLQVQGTAEQLEVADWNRFLTNWIFPVQPEELYLVVRVKPSRIDFVDEDQGWGLQDTLEW
jgi:hypothetical protein